MDGGDLLHQNFTNLVSSALRHSVCEGFVVGADSGWQVRKRMRVSVESTDRSEFLLPDFLICHCADPHADRVGAADTALAGDVLSHAEQQDPQLRRTRYADLGIPWYWEVHLGRNALQISCVRAWALAVGGLLPGGAAPLHAANYIVAGEWTPTRAAGIAFGHPFPATVSWAEPTFRSLVTGNSPRRM
ncbi:Uma2 family endonuclease [Nocardia yunnanensis]|uniref:Uma2 family endonuclease n=1 Tax=Nocardia yunnanensis TaxID=2382165 RepID=A0A386ZIJ5_9NOCA|nr:Uma2 family endonuclease [Nocardia yunnanensis]AYF77306.1 Uma2 family endonuclease [Nocardia yunnanensis]